MATTSSGDMEKMQMVSSGQPEIPEATKWWGSIAKVKITAKNDTCAEPINEHIPHVKLQQTIKVDYISEELHHN